MFHDQIDAFLQVHGTAFLIGYLLVGFIIGFFIVRTGECEDPIFTWLFATVSAPLFAAVALLIALPFIPFVILVNVLGIESSQGDTHGV